MYVWIYNFTINLCRTDIYKRIFLAVFFSAIILVEASTGIGEILKLITLLSQSMLDL